MVLQLFNVFTKMLTHAVGLVAFLAILAIVYICAFFMQEKLLKASRLDDIFCSTDREFAALVCVRSLVDFY